MKRPKTTTNPRGRGKKRKNAARRNGDPIASDEFVDLRKEFLAGIDPRLGDPRTWPPSLRHLEARKMIKKLAERPGEVVSESSLREGISLHLGIRSEDVTGKQIQDAALDLLSRYPKVTVIPSGIDQALRTVSEQAPEPAVQATRSTKTVRSLQSKLTERELKIWEVIQQGSWGPQYCRELGNAKIKPRKTGVWRNCTAGTYLAAYYLGERWPHRIQDEKCKVRRKAELAMLASE